MIDEFRIVAFGSILEETPEGLFRMDRIRMREEEMSRNINQMVHSEVEEFINGEVSAFVFGTGPT